MVSKGNISNVKDCFGCGVCAVSCPKKIIDIIINENGFYEPLLRNEDRCVGCGICIDVCSYLHSDFSLSEYKIQSYAAWSNNSNVRFMCSSGGAGYEIASSLLKHGYKFCGVKYNAEKGRAEHYIASKKEDLDGSVGSKYIQSYTVDGFCSINRNEKYLVVGTPCQIDSFRRYLKKFKCEGNFVLMDFFCHGVPSKLVWDKYCEMVEKKIGKITYASWRNKFFYSKKFVKNDSEGQKCIETGWHNSYNMFLRGKMGIMSSRLVDGDSFLRLFLSDCCLGKQCYDNCRFKYVGSSADIRVGDLWGSMYQNEEKGVNALICFTEKGEEIVSNTENLVVEKSSIEIVTEGQMKNNPSRGKFYNILSESLKSYDSLECIIFRWRFLTSLEKIYLKFFAIFK